MSNTITRLAAFTALTLAAAAAQAAIVTFTTAGTIDFGYDSFGMFGGDNSLGGKSYSESITFNTDGLAAKAVAGGSELSGSDFIYWMKGSVSVGGAAYSWEVDSAQVFAGLYNARTLGLPGGWDWANVLARSSTDGGKPFIDVTTVIYSSAHGLMADSDMQKSHSFALPQDGVTAYSKFYFRPGDGSGYTTFSGTPTSAAWLVSEVPEPGTFTLLLAGLGLVAFAARKQRAAKAG